ncbi:MAG: MOSC domain-containing protein [Paracoccaceae bacterium]
MTVSVAQIWRYPIKGISAEQLAEVTLEQDRPLPFDRAWAILEEHGDDTDGWRSCRNFLRGAKGPELMAITTTTTGATIQLHHPKLPSLSIPLQPGSPTALFDWLAQIYPTDRNAPTAMVKSPDAGMSDAPFASVSILNLSSLAALSEKAGQDLDVRRFRANLWLEGLAPFEEYDLVGKALSLGHTKMDVVEPIGRCRATEANPQTGERDALTLRLLENNWGHTNFGVYAKVVQGGKLTVGDKVTVL